MKASALASNFEPFFIGHFSIFWSFTLLHFKWIGRSIDFFYLLLILIIFPREMNILLEKEGLFEIFSLTTMCLYGGGIETYFRLWVAWSPWIKSRCRAWVEHKPTLLSWYMTKEVGICVTDNFTRSLVHICNIQNYSFFLLKVPLNRIDSIWLALIIGKELLRKW